MSGWSGKGTLAGVVRWRAGDTSAGDVSGEGVQAFSGGWDLVSPAGKKVEKPGS